MTDSVDAAMGDVLDSIESRQDANSDPGMGLDTGPFADVPMAEPCSEDEARALVKRARKTLTSLHDTFAEIISRRAWVALGYENPTTFWLTEFADEKIDGAHGGGYSRVHLARTARVLGLLFGLHELIGDEALAISVSERSLRAIGNGADERLLALAAENIKSLPEDRTPDDLQGAMDRAVEAMRKDAEEAKASAKVDIPPPSMDDLMSRLASIGMGPAVPDPNRPPTDDDDDDEGFGAGNRAQSADLPGWDDDADMPDDRKGFSGGGVGLDSTQTGVQLETAPVTINVNSAQMLAATERSSVTRGITSLAESTITPEEMVAALSADERDAVGARLPAAVAFLNGLQDALDNDLSLDI